MEAIVKRLGFESEKEFHSLVATADLSTPEKQTAFKKWQAEDGSKEGLLKLSGKKHHPSCPVNGACLCGIYEDKERLLKFVRFVQHTHSGHHIEYGCTSGICAEIDKLRKDGLL